MSAKWAVVVPTNRPERYAQFREEWDPWFNDNNATVIPVYDDGVWEGIPDFIPKRTDMIRSWGFYQAWKTDCDYVLSLDDDVSPREVFRHYEEFFVKKMPLAPYLSVGALTNVGPQMRGFPYRDRLCEVVVQYGGWHGVPDVDGETQLLGVKPDTVFLPVVMPVPKGCAVTTCAMNFAFRREYAPIMWQLPMLGPLYNRFGDIWSGLIQKRVLDVLDKVMLINGRASVSHQRASDPRVNFEKEKPGREPNEGLWENLDVSFVEPDMFVVFKAVTNRLALHLKRHDRDYFDHFIRCRDQWLEFFQ